MGRKIILLSDGTGNSAAKVWRSNVWRTFECLDLSGSQQVACYDDGVGTGRVRPLALIGSAFGFGLQRNIIELYKFACRNYRTSDDEIFGFGFSRGAFTIRVVVDLILDQGLVQAKTEAELETQARAAFRAYRAKHFHTLWPHRPERLIRRTMNRVYQALGVVYQEQSNRRNVSVRFLGLWDTVAAYGTPIEELTRGISYWIYPWILPNTKLNDNVKRACHALAIDEDRESFLPVLWDESSELPTPLDKNGRRRLDDDRISQVWFAGAHSNVGGGYPDDSLAHISLGWILSEAKRAGLKLKRGFDASPQSLQHVRQTSDKDGRIYRPRAGLGSYYRYRPRDLSRLGATSLKRKDSVEPTIRIHQSVLARIQNNAHGYAPLGLPARYEIVTPSGEIHAAEQNRYETGDHSQARWKAQQGLSLDITCQRMLHFATIVLSVWLLASPLAQAPMSTTGHSLAWLSGLIQTAGGLFPGVFSPWFEGAAQNVRSLMMPLLLFGIVQLASRRLATHTAARASSLWKNPLHGATIEAARNDQRALGLRTSDAFEARRTRWRQRIAPAFAVTGFLILVFMIFNKLAFNIQDYAGYTCRPSDKVGELQPGDLALKDGNTSRYDWYRDTLRNRLSKRYDEEHLGTPTSTDQAHAKEEWIKKHLPSPLAVLKEFNVRLPEFHTKNFCQSMQVAVEKGRKYLVQIEDPTSFRDSAISAAHGFHATGTDLPWWYRPLFVLGTPLKRNLAQKWFQPTIRYGAVGAVEEHLLADLSRTHASKGARPETIYQDCVTARADGELFMYVNDAVIFLPWLHDFFYRTNNHGQSRVFIKQVTQCPH